MEKISVRNMTGNSGREVPNQFVIQTENGSYFQSYRSIIAFWPKNGGKWNYSKTTGKYRNQFLNEGIDATRQKIKSGDYELVNLN